MRPALAALAAVLVAAPSASAYRNPTPGAALVLQVPGMHRVEVRHTRGLDVYRSLKAHRRLPAAWMAGEWHAHLSWEPFTFFHQRGHH